MISYDLTSTELGILVLLNNVRVVTVGLGSLRHMCHYVWAQVAGAGQNFSMCPSTDMKAR